MKALISPSLIFALSVVRRTCEATLKTISSLVSGVGFAVTLLHRRTLFPAPDSKTLLMAENNLSPSGNGFTFSSTSLRSSLSSAVNGCSLFLVSFIFTSKIKTLTRRFNLTPQTVTLFVPKIPPVRYAVELGVIFFRSKA
jgi:hypothetical protein